MKISKLFHWLYAVLMLLPVAFIAVRCGYVIFNKNAKDSYSGQETQYLSYYTGNQLETGKTYYFTNTNGGYDLTGISGSNANVYVSNFELNNTNYLRNNADWDINDLDYIFFWRSSDKVALEYHKNNSTGYYYSASSQYVNISFNFLQITGSDVFLNNIAVIYTIDNLSGNFLDNAFEYSVNQLNEVPLFSWAQSSFLVAPFSYITGLFGLASTSPINTLLSYWLSISIIWLVFDLVMYLPLLVHRWLDKGVLE